MKGFTKYWIICGLLLGLYLVAQYTKPKPTNWRRTYLPQDKIPFGTYILRQHIADLFPSATQKFSRKTIANTLKENISENANYLLVAGTVKTSKDDVAQMLKYMKAGNHIFVAAFQINGALADTLKLRIGSDFDFQNKTKYPINFTSPHLKRSLGYYFERGIAAQYFTKLDSSRAIVLGQKYEQNANFVKYKFGKGALFLCPNPALFTNYSLLNPNGSDYASSALSYLPQSDILIWDDYYTSPPLNSQSILRVLFQYDELRWAYYIALLGLVVFVLYDMKRRQRIIPVVEPLKNSSVEFAKVVGRVYYQQRNNSDIVEKKINYFLAYIRSKYRLKTAVLDQEFVDTLAKISGINIELIRQLMGYINGFNKEGKVSDQYLIEMNKLMEQFYKLDK